MTDLTPAPIPYDPGSTAWQEQRRVSIGASEVPAVLGLNPWRTPLDVWASKVGLLEGSPSTLATRLGHELEDLIARLWAEQHPDAEVTHNRLTLRHPDRPWFVASTDREVNGDGLLECKLVGMRSSDAWESGPPDYVRAQCYAQMAVTGRQWVDVCSLHTSWQWEHRIHRIDRDDDWIADMLDKVERFWFDHVVAGVAPDLDGDPRRIRETLNRLHPGDDATSTTLSPAVLEDIATLKHAKAMHRDLGNDITRLENDLIALIGDATDAYVDPNEKPVYTYRIAQRTTYDTSAIQSGRLDGFTPDEIATARRVLDSVAKTSRYRTLRIR